MDIWKLQGAGNCFVFVLSETPYSADLVKKLCKEHTGVGSDGLIGINPNFTENQKIKVWMRNPDASPMGMCGNGIRCALRLLHHLGKFPSPESNVTFDVEGREINCQSNNEGRTVLVDMGEYSFEPRLIPIDSEVELINSKIANIPYLLSALSVGNPHCVLLVDSVARDFDEKLANEISCSKLFPEGCNVDFVEIVDRGRIKLEVLERGAGRTLACGTAACAAVVALYTSNKLNNEVLVELPGGNLLVTLDSATKRVKLSGDAVLVFEGKYLDT